MSDQDNDDKKVINSLLAENQDLHHKLHQARKESISIFMAFIHLSAETSVLPASWMLAYVVNNDQSILELDSPDDWPEGYEKKVMDFCDMMEYYNGTDKETIPVREVIENMMEWPYQVTNKDLLH